MQLETTMSFVHHSTFATYSYEDIQTGSHISMYYI